jgi:uncharacterized lipoprotein YddW (UPF0748 family)
VKRAFPMQVPLACVGLLSLTALLILPVSAQPPFPPDLKSNAPSANLPSDPSASHPQASSLAPAETEGEMRGMWVVRESLTSPQSVHQVVVTAVKYHLNALFVQVRGRGDAWYDSPYEPRAESLAGKPHDFDPLQQIIQEGHAVGLEVHAWMNTFLTWSGSRPPRSPQHLWNAHRDWFACDRKGNCSPLPNSHSEGAFLQPSNPEVQQHLFDVYTDVATRYDVDGIHFDYCRYCSSDYDFSASTLARFHAYMATQLTEEEEARFQARLSSDRLAYIHAFSKEWGDWRRAQITGLVARISTAAKASKPWIRISAAVFADGVDAFRHRGQDWQGWLQAGYLDAVALMSYDKSTERILEQTRRAVAASGGRHIYTGIGAWRLQAHDVAHKIEAVRKTGAAGVNLFSYNGVHTRPQYLDTLARGVFASRAAPRRMNWLPDRSKK